MFPFNYNRWIIIQTHSHNLYGTFTADAVLFLFSIFQKAIGCIEHNSVFFRARKRWFATSVHDTVLRGDCSYPGAISGHRYQMPLMQMPWLSRGNENLNWCCCFVMFLECWYIHHCSWVFTIITRHPLKWKMVVVYVMQMAFTRTVFFTWSIKPFYILHLVVSCTNVCCHPPPQYFMFRGNLYQAMGSLDHQ